MTYSDKTKRLGGVAQAMIDFVEEADQVLRMSMTGISMLQAVPQAVKAIAKATGGESTDEFQRKLEQADQQALLAAAQVGAGFPLLYGHATVAIWGVLEATIPKMVTYWLCDNPEAISQMGDHILKIPVQFYVNGSQEAIMGHLVNGILTAAIDGRGIGKFEALLNKVGLGGGFSDERRRILFELSQVRNLIVHQFSSVDETFVRNCPWTNLSVGQKLVLKQEDYAAYMAAAVEYMTVILVRSLAAAKGVPIAEMQAEIESDAAAASIRDRRVSGAA